MNTIELLELAKIGGWVVVLYVLLRKRKGIPLNTYYLIIISSILMIYSGITDLALGHPLEKSLLWLPTDLAVMVVYLVDILRHNRDWELVNSRFAEILSKLENDQNQIKKDENK